MWKDIAGYEGRYQVSDDGQVKSCEHWHKICIKGKDCHEIVLKSWKTRKEKLNAK